MTFKIQIVVTPGNFVFSVRQAGLLNFFDIV
jgi:hypothetical protein